MKPFSIETVPEWGRYLIDKYPLILKEFDPDVAYYFKGEEKDRVNLRYGLECEKGWVLLIEEILAKATELVNRARKKDSQSYIHSFIVKSKMASLRWQGNQNLSDDLLDEWFDFLSEVEDRSLETCEYCGQPGKVDGTGTWIEVKCLDCK